MQPLASAFNNSGVSDYLGRIQGWGASMGEAAPSRAHSPWYTARQPSLHASYSLVSVNVSRLRCSLRHSSTQGAAARKRSQQGPGPTSFVQKLGDAVRRRVAARLDGRAGKWVNSWWRMAREPRTTRRMAAGERSGLSMVEGRGGGVVMEEEEEVEVFIPCLKNGLAFSFSFTGDWGKGTRSGSGVLVGR